MTMQFALYSGETKLGEARFYGSDPPMGGAFFHLLPNENYLTVQPMFQSETMMRLDRDLSPEAANDTAVSDLSIRDEAGVILAAHGGVTVIDAQAEMPEEPIEIWLLGMDKFEHYFPCEYERYEASFRE